MLEAGAALRLPRVPLPLLEVREAVHAQEGDRAVVLVPVVRVEVDADEAIKVADRGWRVEGLRGGEHTFSSVRLLAAGTTTTTHLHPAHVLRDISPRNRPPLRLRRIRLRNAHRKLPKHAAKKLKVRELHRVDADVLAQLDDDERRARRARAQHVPVALRREEARGGARGAVRGVHARGAVQRRVVEAVGQRHAEVRRHGLGGRAGHLQRARAVGGPVLRVRGGRGASGGGGGGCCVGGGLARAAGRGVALAVLGVAPGLPLLEGEEDLVGDGLEGREGLEAADGLLWWLWCERGEGAEGVVGRRGGRCECGACEEEGGEGECGGEGGGGGVHGGAGGWDKGRGARTVAAPGGG